jgi:hypothetical protein
VAWSLAARAQQRAERMRLIGMLMGGPGSDPENQARIAAFLQWLGAIGGWTDGRNVRIDTRSGAADLDRIRLLSTTRKMGHRVAGLRDLRRHRIRSWGSRYGQNDLLANLSPALQRAGSSENR